MKNLIRFTLACLMLFLNGILVAACNGRETTCAHMWTEATCTAPRTCTLCATTEGDVTTHRWDTGVFTIRPSCTEGGTMTFTCVVCSQSKAEAMQALGHTFEGWATDREPTCTTDGIQSHQCSTCHGRMDITSVPALGHEWNDGVILTPPTCSEEGIMTVTCIRCSEDKAEIIDASGHAWTTTCEKSATLITDGTERRKCTTCYVTEVRTLEKIDPSTLNMPIVYITDFEDAAVSLEGLKKEDGEITVRYKYVSHDEAIDDFEGFGRIKIQGASSAGYPKKNFTVKLYRDAQLERKLKVDLGWGKESKYCMKANYIDVSQARNVVAAQMFAQVATSRAHIHAGLRDAPHYGVIDGYPVLVYVNDSFYGLYTMNIPKDEWMFGMEGDETTREAILMAANWTNSVQMHEEIGADYTESGWSLEYCSTADDAWVKESFNELITLLNCRNGPRIKTELANHLDIEAAIDNMIFTYFINAADNTAKNVLWATCDGRIWIPSVYDMDGSFGIYWDGAATDADQPVSTYSICPTYESNGAVYVQNKLYKILLSYYADEVEARYRELRTSILACENTEACFGAFFARVAEIAYQSDIQKWPGIPGQATNRTNMLAATKAQLERLDEFFYHFNH